MNETMFIFASIVFAIVFGLMLNKIIKLTNNLIDERFRHQSCCNLRRINSQIFTSEIDKLKNRLSNRQLIIESLRKDRDELLLPINNQDRIIKFGNDRINHIYNSVYYHPELNEIILLDDLTNIGEL